MPDQLLEMLLRLLRELLAWLPNAPREQSAWSRWGLEVVGGLVGAGLGGLITGWVLLNFTERMQRRLLVPQEEMQQRLLVQHEEMEQRLFTRQSTLQAYGEVLQPLLQNLPGHLSPSTADGGYVAAAGRREQIVRPHWDEARRLLTSPPLRLPTERSIGSSAGLDLCRDPGPTGLAVLRSRHQYGSNPGARSYEHQCRRD